MCDVASSVELEYLAFSSVTKEGLFPRVDEFESDGGRAPQNTDVVFNIVFVSRTDRGEQLAAYTEAAKLIADTCQAGTLFQVRGPRMQHKITHARTGTSRTRAHHTHASRNVTK